MKKHPKFFLSITFFAAALFCPASGKADTAAHAVWGTGIQIGWAEMGAYQGVDPRTLEQSLAYARDMARQTGCIPPDEIERLRVAMSQTGDSRTLYQPISSYRQRAHTNLQRCRCAGGQNAAWALWGLGVQIGWAEMGSYQGMDTQSVLRALTSARDHAGQLSCITTSKIDDLIKATYDVRNTREVFQQITSYRQGQLLSEVQRNCNCGGAGCDVSGRWWHSTRGLPKTSLNFVRQNDGSYWVQEEGLARVSGPAWFDGQTITWKFRLNNREHTSVWRLNSNCTASVSGAHGGTPSTLTRR